MGFQLKVGGKFHLRLNIGNRPIANKYCEGKMKRTLKRELKGLEIAKREPFGTSVTAFHTAAAITAEVSWRDVSQHRLGARESASREGGLALIYLGCPVVKPEGSASCTRPRKVEAALTARRGRWCPAWWPQHAELLCAGCQLSSKGAW